MLLTILRSSVLPHKHPHELLDSVVKERFDQVFRLNRGRAFYSSLSTCQALFRKFLFYSIACRLAEPTTSRSGRRIIQRQFPLSTAFFSPPRSIRPRHQQRHNLRPASAGHSTRIRHLCNLFQPPNLLIQKAFFAAVRCESGAHYRGLWLGVNSDIQLFSASTRILANAFLPA